MSLLAMLGEAQRQAAKDLFVGDYTLAAFEEDWILMDQEERLGWLDDNIAPDGSTAARAQFLAWAMLFATDLKRLARRLDLVAKKLSKLEDEAAAFHERRDALNRTAQRDMSAAKELVG